MPPRVTMKGGRSQQAIRTPIRAPKAVLRTRTSPITGKSQDFYIKQASEEYLDDMKDFYLSLAVLDDIKSGKERLLTEEEMWDGLDD